MTQIVRAVDPWAVVLALVAAVFGAAVGLHPLVWIGASLAIVAVHQLAVVANPSTDANSGRAPANRGRRAGRQRPERRSDRT